MNNLTNEEEKELMSKWIINKIYPSRKIFTGNEHMQV